jgi:hypothetical protein
LGFLDSYSSSEIIWAIEPFRIVALLRSNRLGIDVTGSGSQRCLVKNDHSDDPFMLHLQNHVWEDVTLHNSSLPPLAIKNPECLGLLHQLDRNIDMWVQHYCILKDGCLYFYASIRSTQASGKKSAFTWNNKYNNNSNATLALLSLNQTFCYLFSMGLTS